MKKTFSKDVKYRLSFFKYELIRLRYKYIINDLNLNLTKKYFIYYKLNNLNKNSWETRIKNHCFISYRGSAFFRFCGLSRVKLREYSLYGRLVGVRKASW